MPCYRIALALLATVWLQLTVASVPADRFLKSRDIDVADKVDEEATAKSEAKSRLGT